MTTQRERILRRIERAERDLAHKRAIMARHQPGTSWHTRARLEAEAIERRLAGLRAGLV